jgi:hypothetical protein
VLHHQKHSRLTSLLQSAYCNQQLGASQNFHQLVENARVIVVGTGLKVFLQYELRFADGLKSQLLISHRFLPFEAEMPQKSTKLTDQVIFWIYPLNFCFKPLASPSDERNSTGSMTWRVVSYSGRLCCALQKLLNVGKRPFGFDLEGEGRNRRLVPNPTEQAALTREGAAD